MRNIRDIKIIKAVIHILDNSMEEPVLNEDEIELNDEICEFLTKHIVRSSSDDEAKCAVFNEGENLVMNLSNQIIKDNDTFLINSREIAKHFFDVMKSNPGTPSGDLIICLFTCEAGITLGIMKLDYNKTYIHSIDYNNGKMIITIIPQMIGLPASGQRLQKCAFISLKNGEYEVLLLDKDLKNNDENIKPELLSQLLNCDIIKDKRDITKDILSKSENWIRENLVDDAESAEKVRSIITKTLKSDDVINIETMAHYAFEDKAELKEDYLERIKGIGLESSEVPNDREWAEKKLKRKRIKIDKDIEIYIDSIAYEDDERFEIKRNGDGTINIILKHIRNYIEKQ